MHKWELRNKQKQHDAIIQNARPSVTKVYSHSKSIKSSSHHRPIKLTPNSRKLNLKNQMPINKILKLFQLQKYTDLITDKKLQKLIESEDSILDIQNLIEQADVQDKQKLTSLVHTLIVMSKDIKKNPIKVIKLKQSDHTLPSLNKNKKQSNEKTVQKFRVRPTLHHRTPEKPVIQVHYEVHKKNESFGKSQSKDDSHFVHEFDIKGENADTCEGYITQMKNKNHVLRRLFERLEYQRHAQHQLDKQININAIQNMYQSFQSGRLNSNISDLDFQGMLYCLALETKGLCDKGQLTRVFREKQEVIEDLLRQSILMHYHEDQRDEEVLIVGEMKKNIKTHSNEVIANPEDPQTQDPIQIDDIKNFIQNIILEYQISKDNLIKAYILLQDCMKEELIDVYHTNWKYMIIAILFCLNFENMMKGKSEIHLVWDKIKEEPYIDGLMSKKTRITKKQYVNAYFAMRASLRSGLDNRKFGNSKNQRIKINDIIRMQNHGEELRTKAKYLNKQTNKSF